MLVVTELPVGQKIRIAREARRPPWSQYRLADEIGISRAALANWELGRSEPKERAVRRIAAALYLPFDWFYDGQAGQPPSSDPAHDRNAPRPVQPAETGTVRISGLTSAGGGWTDSPTEEEVELPKDFTTPDMQGTWVEGDSMMPTLWPRDVVIFKNRPSARPGEIVVARLAKETADRHGYENLWVVKRYMMGSEGRYVLRSDNPRYEDIEGEFAIAGFLVGVIRDDEEGRVIRLNGSGLRLRPPAAA